MAAYNKTCRTILTSESDSRSYVVTDKAQKKFWLRTRDLRDTGAMLYRLGLMKPR